MANRTTKPLPRFDYYEADPEGFHLYSWCPAPPGSTDIPPTQVHLHIPIAGSRIIIRFKGPKTLDRFISALQEHRKDVFG